MGQEVREPSARGCFVTFEGGEGSGKSSQIARLTQTLREHGIDPLVTREPGGTPLAESIRALLLESGSPPTALAEALLMEAARADLVARVIRPALEAGRVVLCDRYADSTLAYQGGGRGIDAATLERLNQLATGGLEPDLTILLDLEVETGIRRRESNSGTTNRLDREPLEFHRRVRERYLDLAQGHPGRWVILDGTEDPARIAPRIWDAVRGRLMRA